MAKASSGKTDYGFVRTRAVLPRDRSRLAERLSLARFGRLLYRYSGVVLAAFVLLHLTGQAFLRVPALHALVPPLGRSFLVTFQHYEGVRALLTFSVVFHFLYGLRMMLSEVGLLTPHRPAITGSVVLALILAIWEGLA